MSYERQSPYTLSFCLLLAGAIPELAWTAGRGFTADLAKSTPSAAALGPQLSQAALFYPAVAGLLALFLAWSMPRWLRAFGFIGLGASLLAFTADRGGVAVAVNRQFDSPGPWDVLLLGGLALAFAATRAQAVAWPSLPLSLLGALGGLAVLVWLLVPRGPSGCEVWLGLVSQGHPDTIPIARGFLRNGEFAAGTHIVWYVWWNLYLAALVAFPLLCLRVPSRAWELREGAADSAYGTLVFVLLSLALMAAAAAALDHQLKPRSPDGAPAGWQPALVGAANAARLVFPPLLLAALALAGVSDLFKGLSNLRLPRWRGAGGPPPLPGERTGPREAGRIPLVTDRYMTSGARRWR